MFNRHQCSCTTGLEYREQLRQCTFHSDTSSARGHTGAARIGHSDCPVVASTNVIPQTGIHGYMSSITNSEHTSGVHRQGAQARTTQEPQLEDLCLANIWREKLVSQGWPSEACDMINL